MGCCQIQGNSNRKLKNRKLKKKYFIQKKG